MLIQNWNVSATTPSPHKVYSISMTDCRIPFKLDHNIWWRILTPRNPRSAMYGKYCMEADVGQSWYDTFGGPARHESPPHFETSTSQAKQWRARRKVCDCFKCSEPYTIARVSLKCSSPVVTSKVLEGVNFFLVAKLFKPTRLCSLPRAVKGSDSSFGRGRVNCFCPVTWLSFPFLLDDPSEPRRSRTQSSYKDLEPPRASHEDLESRTSHENPKWNQDSEIASDKPSWEVK